MEPLLPPLLAKIQREITRLVFLGLVLTYGLSAWNVCGGGMCNAGAPTAIFAILDETRDHLWQGTSLAFMLEFAGGAVFMTIGLAWDWWKERPAKAAAKAKAEAYAVAYAEAQAEFQTQAAAYRERLLRNGIDPDTGERLPNFNNGANATDDHV